MGAEQPGEDLGLGLAQLGELLGHVGDRAVVLAELLPRSSRRRAGRGSVAVGRQRLGEGLGPAARRAPPATGVAVAGLELGHPLAGERGDRLAAALLLDEAQGAGGEVVVGLVERVAAGRGQREEPGRAAAAAGGGGARRALLDQPVGEQRVQVAAHGGRREAQGLGQAGGGGGAGLEDGAGDPVAGRVLEGVFHNTSVALFGTDRKRRAGQPAWAASHRASARLAADDRDPHPARGSPRACAALGVRAGDILLVHTSVKALGWIPGGPLAVVQALRDAVGESGTLVVPTQTGHQQRPRGVGRTRRSRRPGGR